MGPPCVRAICPSELHEVHQVKGKISSSGPETAPTWLWRLTFPLPTRSFCLSSGFEKTKKRWFLEELQRVLEEVDKDANFALIEHDLRDFADADEDFDFNEDRAQIFVEHFQERWPEVKHVTVDNVIALREAMVEAGFALEYRLLRSFVAEGVYRLTLSKREPGDLIDIVKEVSVTAERMLPIPESTPSLSPFAQTSFLHALRDYA